MIVGGKVTSGKIKKGVKVDVQRNGEFVLNGKIGQLQHNKKDANEVLQGSECGMMIVPSELSDVKIEVQDTLEIYTEDTKTKTLS